MPLNVVCGIFMFVRIFLILGMKESLTGTIRTVISNLSSVLQVCSVLFGLYHCDHILEHLVMFLCGSFPHICDKPISPDLSLTQPLVHSCHVPGFSLSGPNTYQ